MTRKQSKMVKWWKKVGAYFSHVSERDNPVMIQFFKGETLRIEIFSDGGMGPEL